MDSSTGYSTTPTIDLYNIHLQQQRHPNQLPQQYPQHQQDLPSLHQHQYPDPNEVAASEMIWENQKKHKYILSPPEEHQCTYNQHYPSNMYYNNADKPLNEFYHHRENPNLVKAEDTSLFIDSSLHRQPTITANMHNREDNMSESSSNNTIPSTDSTTRKKVVNNRKQDLKTTEFKKSNRPNVVIEKKRYRRESHNDVERRRRNNINDNIKSLGQLLPDNMREGKLNKGSILKGSVAYIRMLNEQLSKYKERLENLQYEAANMSAISARSSI